jgi:hypothetical protein
MLSNQILYLTPITGWVEGYSTSKGHLRFSKTMISKACSPKVQHKFFKKSMTLQMKKLSVCLKGSTPKRGGRGNGRSILEGTSVGEKTR